MKMELNLNGAGTLGTIQKDFSTWRENRRKREPIPDHLLKKAVKLCRIHGMAKVSRHLKINYMTLKKHNESGVTTGFKTKEAKTSEPYFLELRLDKQNVDAPFNPVCEITIEKPDGSRIKLRLANEPSVTLMQIINNL
jgi:hypothetical protein